MQMLNKYQIVIKMQMSSHYLLDDPRILSRQETTKVPKTRHFLDFDAIFFVKCFNKIK